jgi:hypothetical protein
VAFQLLNVSESEENNTMTSSTRTLTIAAALAALTALPVSALAQTAPPDQPPTTPQAQPAIDQQAAKQHLTAARDTLSQVTQLPAAAQLTGDARTQVSQLISNFNELITTQTSWQESLAKVQANLTALLGPPSEAKPASGNLDPSIQARLVEFRKHLENFEKVAAGRAAAEPPPATPPTSAPPTSAPPATPPTTAPPTAPPTQPQAPQPPTAPAGEPVLVDQQQALRHINAIEAILTPRPAGAVGTAGTTAPATAMGTPLVTIDRAQLETLKTHLAELKRLMEKK